MGLILKTNQDYDSIRGALGLNFDVKRELTNEVIDQLQFLPAAEIEALSRLAEGAFITLMQLAPSDANQLSLKIGTIALTCANLCERLQVTIPTDQKMEDLGGTTIVQINWPDKKTRFLSDANRFFYNINPMFMPQGFPVAMATARGRILRFDPDFYRSFQSEIISNFGGYTSPSGNYYQVGIV